MASRLIKNSKLTNRQIGKLIDLFALEVPANKAAKALKIHRHSAERVYHTIRLCLAIECEKQSPFNGEVEVDESYFGGYRKGNRGRGAAGKVPVFGILKRNGKVYTRIVNDVSRQTLQIKALQNLASSTATRCWLLPRVCQSLTDSRKERVNKNKTNKQSLFTSKKLKGNSSKWFGEIR